MGRINIFFRTFSIFLFINFAVVMKRMLIVVVLIVASHRVAAQDTLLVFFWNLENFFDTVDGGQSESDREFSADGQRHWTKKRFYTKCSAVAKTIMFTADRYGRLPDICAFAEIENSFVLSRIINSTLLRKFGYAYVHYDSPDPRGIDTGLIYRKPLLQMQNSRPCHVGATRDILQCSFITISGTQADVLVCHLPSKRGGERESLARRKAAAGVVSEVCDSLYDNGKTNLIVCGDFNDTPDSEAFALLEDKLCCKSDSLFRQGRGSIKYEGRWELIDLFYVSDNLVSDCSADIGEYPFLLTRDSAHSGIKPLRTWSGPRYNGGVSDHLPVQLLLHFPKNMFK